MARASFGGGGDYSGFFGSLYRSNKSAAQAEQDAKDADMADQWQNGLITDEVWLEYIRTRIDQETDPKRNERWVEALRKYGPAIADAQMIAKYEAGEATIGELITHYEGRLAGTVADSNENREITKTLNDLKDKRAGDNLSKQAEDLINDIEAGKAKYEDLLTLYKDQLKSLRPNSDLYKSVEGQIEKVNDTIKSNKIEGELAKQQYLFDSGKISAGSYAAQVKKLAENFKTSDPARYWNLLRAAQGIASGGGRSGGGRSGGGGGGTSSTATIDALQAQRNKLWGIVEQIESGAKQGVDPDTGAIIAFTPAYIKSIDTQLMGTYDQLSAAYMAKTKKDGTPNPDKSAAQNAQTSKTKYIIDHAQKHNEITKEEQHRNLLTATVKRIQAAGDLSDPEQARQAIINAASDYDKWVQGLNKIVINNGEDDVQIGGPLALQDQVTPEFLQNSQTLASAMRAIASGDEAQIRSAMDMLAGSNLPSEVQKALVEPAFQVVARADGVADGRLVQVYDVNGNLKYVETGPVRVQVPNPDGSGTMITTTRLEPLPEQLAAETGMTNDGSTKIVEMWIDQGGQPAKAKAVVQMTGTGSAYYTTKQTTINGIKVAAGTRLSSDQVAWLRKSLGKADGPLDGFEGLTRGYAVNYYQTTINGQTWYQDPETQLWYKDALPIRNWEVDPIDGTWKIDKDGKAVLDWRSYSSAEGAPVLYVGSNGRSMQSMIEELDPETIAGLRGRDALGNLTAYDPNDLQDAFYSPINKYTGFNTDPDSWWNKDQQKAKSEKKYSRFTAEIRGRETGDISFKTIKETKPEPENPIEKIGKAFGITFGTKTDARHQGLVDKRKSAGIVPEVNKNTGFDISKLPDPKAASGPKLANGFVVLPDVKGGTKADLPKAKPLPKISAPKPPKVNKDTISSNEMAQQRVEQQKSGGPAGRV